jgi:hypothetical protein
VTTTTTPILWTQASRLRTWRGDRLQPEAATALGISLRAYLYYEHGERPMPVPVAKLFAMMEKQK